MQKNETEPQIQQLQAALRRNKEQLANTLTSIFDLEAENTKEKGNVIYVSLDKTVLRV